jgi:hypothetical protein
MAFDYPLGLHSVEFGAHIGWPAARSRDAFIGAALGHIMIYLLLFSADMVCGRDPPPPGSGISVRRGWGCVRPPGVAPGSRPTANSHHHR